MEAPPDQRPPTTHAADLFICFPSRRRRRPSRLRTSGSLKGGQSPAFFAGTRKKGATFDPVEPSSPKVTCIGQVRVKTSRRRRRKKAEAAAAAALRSRSRSGREMSFRRTEQSGETVDGSQSKECFRSRSWVHLPLGGICGAIRAFGSEINCFGRRRTTARRRRRSVCLFPSCSCSCSCGFEERRREEKVVEEEVMGLGRTRERRGLDLVADELERGLVLRRKKEQQQQEQEQEQELDLSACVPPKNALLLMRCRSDPARVSALENRFFGNPALNARVEIEEVEEEEEEESKVLGLGSSSPSFATGTGVEEEKRDTDAKARRFPHESAKDSILGNGFASESVEMSEIMSNHEEEQIPPPSIPEEEEEEEKSREEVEEEGKKKRSTEKEEKRRSILRRSFSIEKDHMRRSTSHREGGRRSSFSSETEARRSSFSTERDGRRRWSFSSEKESRSAAAPAAGGGAKVRRTEEEEEKKLPDCLLLMMYEPKLSMEVSKETWVCSADFVRWQSQRRRRNAGGKGKPPAEEHQEVQRGGEEKELVNASLVPDNKCVGEDKEPVTTKPVEPKPVVVPFALTRCKSEPTRLLSGGEKLLSPEGCFWKNRPRLIGAAGIGF